MTESDSSEEVLDEYLVRKGFSPEKFAQMIASGRDITEPQIMELIRDNYSLTSDPGRRSFDYCLRCNPYLNGSHGKDGTEAVAKRKIPDERGVDQALTGWEGLCHDCASSIQSNPHVDLQPLPGCEKMDIFQSNSDSEENVVHECTDPSWNKLSLVTEEGMFDWVECEECGIQAKRFGPYKIEVVGFDAR